MNSSSALSKLAGKLQQHFGQTSEDVRQVLISVEKIEKRGERIRDVEFVTAGPSETEGAGAADLLQVPLRRREASG
jgi:DNA recombination protein RmuC